MGLLDRIRKAQGELDETAPAIDLTEAAGRGAPGQPAVGERKPVWGRPSRCPDCNGRGYLDHIDLHRRVMYQHCVDCMHKWEIAEADTVPA